MHTDMASKNTDCDCSAAKSSRRLAHLASALVFLCFIWAVYWPTNAFEDHDRYELYHFGGFDGTAAYKLDKKTGKVTGIFNLYEFEVEPFEEAGETAHWQWQNRSATLGLATQQPGH